MFHNLIGKQIIFYCVCRNLCNQICYYKKEPLQKQRFFYISKNPGHFYLSHHILVPSLSGPCLVIAAFTFVVFTAISDVG